MNRFDAFIMLLCIGYTLVWAVRFLIELTRLPRGTLTNALSEAEFDWKEDDRHNPILRDRRFAEARGDYLA